MKTNGHTRVYIKACFLPALVGVYQCKELFTSLLLFTKTAEHAGSDRC